MAALPDFGFAADFAALFLAGFGIALSALRLDAGSSVLEGAITSLETPERVNIGNTA
jgi:hypothetical protein